MKRKPTRQRKLTKLERSMLIALRANQFGFNHNRCCVCAGWDGQSENNRRHAADCIVGTAIKAAEEVEKLL